MNPHRASYGRPRHFLTTQSLAWLLALLFALGGCAGGGAAGWAPPSSPDTPEDVSAVLAGARGDFSQVTGASVAPQWASSALTTAASTADQAASGTVAGSVGTEPDAAEPTAAAPTCPTAGARVLLIGDSLSVGLGPVMAKHARACGTPFHHHGVVGAHVTQWVHDSWLRPQLERAEPTIVVVSLGGNDFPRHDREIVESAVQRLVAKIRERGAQLLWISPPTMPFDDDVDARTMWQRAIDGERGHDWYPTETLLIPRAPDRVHPTIAGYHELGAILWRWVASEAA